MPLVRQNGMAGTELTSAPRELKVLDMKTFKDQSLKGASSLKPHAEAPSSAQNGSSWAANVNLVQMVQDEHRLTLTDNITSREYCARLMCRAVQKTQARCIVRNNNAEVMNSVLGPPVRFCNFCLEVLSHDPTSQLQVPTIA